MITKINTFNSNNQPRFKATPNITKSGYAILTGNPVHQVSSLKSVCKEILLRINNDKSLIAAAVAALGGIKLTETAITFFANEKDAIRLSMPRGAQGDLFKMQIIKDEKPENTIILDNFNKMVDSYSLNTTKYIKEKKVDKNLIDAIIDGVFNTVDEPLFQVRMFVRKNSTEQNKPVEKIEKITLPKPKEIKEAKLAKEAEEEKNKKFIPTVEQMKNYSVSELIRQQAAKEPVSKKANTKKGRKIFEKRLIPVSQLTPEKRAQLKPPINNEEIPPLTLENGIDVSGVVLDLKKETITIESKKSRRKTKTYVTKNSEPKRRGRPAKFLVENVNDYSQAGKLNSDIKSKIKEIENLKDEILKNLRQYSRVTAIKIRSAFKGVTTRGERLTIGKFSVISPKREDFKDTDILTIIDSSQKKSINIVNSEKIVANNIDWKKTGHLPQISYLTQEELDKKANSEEFSSLIEKVMADLTNFKAFLDTKGWRQDTKIKPEIITGKLNPEKTPHFNSAIEKYNKIIEFSKTFKLHQLRSIKDSFGELEKVKSATRLEFIDPFNDGLNLSFNISNSRHGQFYILAKNNKTNDLDELFVFSKNGEVVKSVYKNRGLSNTLPQSPLQKIKYYTQEELEQEGIEKRIEELLTTLEEKMSNYEKILYATPEKKVSRKRQRAQVEKTENTNNAGSAIDLASLKNFFDKTIAEFQTKADNLSKVTGFKTILDSVTENLKTKFDEFLNNQKG